MIDYTERPGAKDLVRVLVSVETESQRGILIGRGGSALKQLSTAARLSIEDFLGQGSHTATFPAMLAKSGGSCKHLFHQVCGEGMHV